MNGEDEQTGPALEADQDESEAQADVVEDEVTRLRKDLETSAKRVDELLDRLKRAQADYENLQKRTAREAEDVRAIANEALLSSLLPVLDDFDQAIAALSGESGEGIRMLHGKLWSALQEVGLETVDPAGRPFDPYDQEVVGQADDSEMEDGVVKEVVQKGYRYRRRLLRPAKVIVVKRGE